MTNEIFVSESLDLNLFFLRILKEHGLFIAAGFPGKNEDLIKEALNFNTLFNNHLHQAVNLARGIIPIKNDAVTEYTLTAEEKTAQLSGIPIDTGLTQEEMQLTRPRRMNVSDALVANVFELNNRSIRLARGIVIFKTKVLDSMLNCTVFNINYPLLIDHIRREAILFIEMLTKLQNREDPIDTLKEALEQEAFWNLIMAEHSEFIRGYLDPSERELFSLANDFANKFYELEKNVYSASVNKERFLAITNNTLKATAEIQNFKTQGTIGLLECKIKSVIIPLLGDHVIREANHYLNLLERLVQMNG